MTYRINNTAIETIAKTAQQSRDGLETGGILLGIDHSGDVLITSAGTPGPNARRASHSFHRDLDHANQLSTLAWHTDGSQWIGEWHTHPSQDLRPSELDLTSYLRHVHDPELRLDRFIAIIVGLTAQQNVRMQTWIVTRTHVRSASLLISEADPH
ncbi:Mov34/MPN/PAD-1 family protein [Nocardia puris]|uniref:Integrative and conjugative element protein (TIGR02256 family) n=1 Tax=Nocardia puris TaxID=208602 RepID=A0A366CUY3_9NOCA|nr:Mov34/MPN/PAD-1 family protein [Nocardia puris]RBO79929.1 integrative and conjugative element protein (TIGR02256 family) [Nocardia puris]